ncbi:bifunctional glutamate--cysteine ligase GshA/glutathione synthetase GshB [Listeria kieliensis]
MINLDQPLLAYLQDDPKLAKQVFSGHFGLEKENLRVTPSGQLALTPHPAVFGKKEDNPLIKTDFSESQIEMITPVCDSVEEVYEAVSNLHHIVTLALENDELLWPNSNPPLIPEEEKIPIAVYDDGANSSSRQYREHLAKEYGKKIQLLSGTHFNFSFSDTLLKELFNAFHTETESYQDFKNRVYLKTAKYFMKNRWLLVYLTGAGPAYMESFTKIASEEPASEGAQLIKEGISLRNSSSGYKNKESLHINYDTFDGYITTIREHIEAGQINSMREFYNPIRLKNSHTDQSLDGLAEKGVEYLEIRSIDLDPLEEVGIAKETLHFLQLFLLTGLLSEDMELCPNNQEVADRNEEITALFGLSHPTLTDCSGKRVPFVEAGMAELDKIEQILDLLAPKNKVLHNVLAKQKDRLLYAEKTIAAQVVTNIKQRGYLSYHLDVARDSFEQADLEAYRFIGAEDLELSTQIVWKAAWKKGVSVEILDRAENFLRLSKKGHTELVKQATKTSRDNYISVLLMENKVVTKKILAENGIRVPFGENFTDIEVALESYAHFKGKQIVVKPKSTNYGLGISIFKDDFNQDVFHEALKIAFSYDESVIIEEFIPGDEYRFLVIGNQIEAVLQRVPANVIGDGVHTIAELVDEKNDDPLRGTDHLKPLEKILKGPEETLMLGLHHLNWDSIPERDRVVYLRENSNISTGGDSIDVTDEMDSYYKDTAIKAAKVADAKFCGVDIIVPPNPTDYEKAAIIELNFNPAIQMHTFPYEGKRRMIGDRIIDYLFNE